MVNNYTYVTMVHTIDIGCFAGMLSLGITIGTRIREAVEALASTIFMRHMNTGIYKL